MDTLVDFMGGGQYANAEYAENATETVFGMTDNMNLQKMSWNRIYNGGLVAGCVLPERKAHYVVFMNDAPNPQIASGPYLLKYNKNGMWVDLNGATVDMPQSYMYQRFFHPRYNSIEDKYYA